MGDVVKPETWEYNFHKTRMAMHRAMQTAHQERTTYQCELHSLAGITNYARLSRVAYHHDRAAFNGYAMIKGSDMVLHLTLFRLHTSEVFMAADDNSTPHFARQRHFLAPAVLAYAECCMALVTWRASGFDRNVCTAMIEKWMIPSIRDKYEETSASIEGDIPQRKFLNATLTALTACHNAVNAMRPGLRVLTKPSVKPTTEPLNAITAAIRPPNLPQFTSSLVHYDIG